VDSQQQEVREERRLEMRLRAKWHILAVSCVLAAAVSVVACGSDTPTAPTVVPTPTPNPYPYDGYWVGTTSEGNQVIFRIVGNAVVQATVYYNITSSCYTWIVAVTSAPIQTGAFTLALPSSYLTAPMAVTGTLSSTTMMNGTIGAMTINAGHCGTTAETQKAAMTYTAMQ
jgi:hypothetical protein